MRARPFRASLAGAVACLSIASVAPAEHTATASQSSAKEAASVVGVVDPWSDEGDSAAELARTEFLLEETLDPWRGRRAPSVWTRVRSGLDSGPALASTASRRARTASPPVGSGIDLPAPEAPPPASWIHPDVIDPWASDSR
jgi:hypothetical protein